MHTSAAVFIKALVCRDCDVQDDAADNETSQPRIKRARHLTRVVLEDDEASEDSEIVTHGLSFDKSSDTSNVAIFHSAAQQPAVPVAITRLAVRPSRPYACAPADWSQLPNAQPALPATIFCSRDDVSIQLEDGGDNATCTDMRTGIVLFRNVPLCAVKPASYRAGAVDVAARKSGFNHVLQLALADSGLFMRTTTPPALFALVLDAGQLNSSRALAAQFVVNAPCTSTLTIVVPCNSTDVYDAVISAERSFTTTFSPRVRLLILPTHMHCLLACWTGPAFDVVVADACCSAAKLLPHVHRLLLNKMMAPVSLLVITVATGRAAASGNRAPPQSKAFTEQYVTQCHLATIFDQIDMACEVRPIGLGATGNMLNVIVNIGSPRR